MEYIVSARKYRPMTFDSVVGQSTIATTLKNAVRSGKLAHAYLFSGPRGVGKTTCARIFAKAINCLHPTADGEACGECESCQAFNEQRSLNIFELDAASNNGIEHIKTLIEQTRVPPQIGKYKVFIIDEVHQLSTSAFNAFLKTLEEPPAHVIFILATTEKQKLLPTIISRCQLYDFERMTVADMVNHLKHVAAQEGYQYEEEALNLIAEKADGGMRDALSIFDQTASFCQGNITYAKVVEDLNVLDADNYFRLVDLALENKVADMMLLLDSVISKGFDGGQLVNGLAAHIRYVMMARDSQTTALIDKSESLRQRYAEQAQRCKPLFLYNALRILNQCDLSYRQSGNKRLLVELTLIEVAQLTQESEDPPGGRRPKRRLKFLFRNPQKSSASTAGKQVAETAAPHSQPQVAPGSVGRDAIATPPSPTPKPKKRPAVLSLKSIIATKSKEDEEQIDDIPSSPDAQSPFTQADVQREWTAMCNRMNATQAGLAARLRNVVPQLAEGNIVRLTLPNDELRKQVAAVERRIAKTLQLTLRNSTITLAISVDTTAATVNVITNGEFLQHLNTTYPLYRKLAEQLQLMPV